MVPLEMRTIELSATLTLALCASTVASAASTSPTGKLPGGASSVFCKRVEGSLDGPFVPNAATARQIFIAVRAVVAPDLHSAKNSSVTVRDAGQYWVVTQQIRVRESGGKLISLMGGAGISMKVDKCSGAVLEAAFNR